MALIGTIEDQERLGIRPSGRTTFVQSHNRDELTTAEQTVLGQALATSGTVMAHRQMSHLAKSEDTALTITFSSLVYAAAYGVAAVMIVAPVVLLAFWAIGGDIEIYYLAFFLLWGVCILVALYGNRAQGLWHSPAGLDHHEIDSRERIAIFAIEKHVELLEKKWGLK